MTAPRNRGHIRTQASVVIITAPQVTAWVDLSFFHEEVDEETAEFQNATFAVVEDDDTAYFGKLNHPKGNITFEQITSALAPIPDNDIYPEWMHSDAGLTRAQDTLPSNMYIKRPNIPLYDIFQEHNVLHLIPQGLLEESRTMEMLLQHLHPDIIRYHGCRVPRRRITGLVLDRHPNTLTDYLKNAVGCLDNESLMQALSSAVGHLHSLSWAHNDLNPSNILVNEEGMPVLIDFGSAREVDAKLGTSRGTKGWIDGDMGDHHTSDKRHDLFALEKIRTWLNAPTFDN